MPIDLDQVARFAQWVHDGQERKYSREPFFEHPRRVAEQLAWLTYPSEDERLTTVAVGYLHDTYEDRPARAPLSMLRALFGSEVACMVEALTSRTKVFPERWEHATRAEKVRANLDALAQAPSSVHLVKLFDRADNLDDLLAELTLGNRDFAVTYVRESRDLYAMARDAFENNPYSYGRFYGPTIVPGFRRLEGAIDNLHNALAAATITSGRLV